MVSGQSSLYQWLLNWRVDVDSTRGDGSYYTRYAFVMAAGLTYTLRESLKTEERGTDKHNQQTAARNHSTQGLEYSLKIGPVSMRGQPKVEEK